MGEVHKITGKNSVGILADVVKCGLKYGAGFNDYLLCEFYNLTTPSGPPTSPAA